MISLIIGIVFTFQRTLPLEAVQLKSNAFGYPEEFNLNATLDDSALLPIEEEIKAWSWGAKRKSPEFITAKIQTIVRDFESRQTTLNTFRMLCAVFYSRSYVRRVSARMELLPYSVKWPPSRRFARIATMCAMNIPGYKKPWPILEKLIADAPDDLLLKYAYCSGSGETVKWSASGRAVRNASRRSRCIQYADEILSRDRLNRDYALETAIGVYHLTSVKASHEIAKQKVINLSRSYLAIPTISSSGRAMVRNLLRIHYKIDPDTFKPL